MKHGIFDYYTVTPLKGLGLTASFWTVHLDTLIYTWAAMGILLALAIIGRIYIKRNPNPISLSYEMAIGFFIDLCKDSFGSFNYRYFAFISSLFFFTLFCCLIGLIPFLDESTKDLNTTFALGLCSFLYIQREKIRVFGVWGYIKKFFKPIFLLAPINIIGEVAKVASMAFRLFGNILGGNIIFGMLINLIDQKPVVFGFLGYATIIIGSMWVINKKKDLQNTAFSRVINIGNTILLALVYAQMFFGIFEGLIQAFVLTMLTTTFLAMGTSSQSDH